MRMRLFFALLWLVFAVETLPQPQKSLVVSHISVVDVSTGETKPDMTVIISDGRIREIGNSTTSRIPEGAQVVEAKGKFLIPGLCDMHVHMFNQVGRRPPNRWYFPLFVAIGNKEREVPPVGRAAADLVEHVDMHVAETRNQKLPFGLHHLRPLGDSGGCGIANFPNPAV